MAKLTAHGTHPVYKIEQTKPDSVDGTQVKRRIQKVLRSDGKILIKENWITKVKMANNVVDFPESTGWHYSHCVLKVTPEKWLESYLNAGWTQVKLRGTK